MAEEIIAQAEIFAIGLGECGSNLVASYFGDKKTGATKSSRIRDYLIMNTDRTDLTKTRERYGISKNRTLLYGNVDIGVGGRFMDGLKTVEESKELIFNQLRELGFEGVNGFVLFTSLGGGTGCGGTPALIKLLRKRFEQEENRRIFIYVIGVLPFADQSSESINTVWSLSHLLRAQMDGNGPDLILLLSNRTMLNRVLSWQRGEISDLLQDRIGGDILNFTKENKKQKDKQKQLKSESEFIDLINPLAMEAIDYMLSPGIAEVGKTVSPTTDLADYSRKLDSVVVPVLFKDVPFFPEVGDLENQFQTIMNFSVTKQSLTDMGKKPDAESVYAIFSGSKEISRVEYSPILKKTLKNYIAKGAAVTHSFISYDHEVNPALLMLFGLPKVPEIKDILEEAKALIRLHSGRSNLKEHWFQRSKGVGKDVLEQAVTDLEQLFGAYIKEGTDQKSLSALD
ncbi:MAG: Tubulin-like protein CetZ [Candidatus Heimdallarchaeota archaeon LC_3]|nr:MAG: Tubulin-like protein CetZ [Candidatus Heimdallarchaeota archaeon LC_3]